MQANLNAAQLRSRKSSLLDVPCRGLSLPPDSRCSKDKGKRLTRMNGTVGMVNDIFHT